MTRHLCRPARRGFTLVELLVVIGIIAVLIGILMPTLTQARRQAERAKCLAALQQTGQAFMMYSANNKGAWPMQRLQGPSGSGREKRFYDFLSPYLLNGKEINPDGTNINGVAATDVKDGNNVIWGCPTWRRMTLTTTWADATIHTGYNMNIYPFAPGDMDPPTGIYRVNQFKIAQQNVVGANYIANPTTPLGPDGFAGKFFKQSMWTKPTDRALMFDAVHPLTVLSNKTAEPDYITKWPFKPENPGGEDFPLEPNALFIGFDWNRHGKNQKRNDFDVPSMNMLFCDGHASFVSTREAFKAIRFK
jgi:prepilin-type N-terminal cleavage/methylation domain-containing protein/prepilin-type processing-associated H-X9-DG protein